MKKICFVSTTASSITFFLDPIIKKLSNKYKVTIICNNSNSIKYSFNKNVNFCDIGFSRKVNFFNDLYCLVLLFFNFLIYRYDCVHSIMPKTGFLCAIASRFTFIKNRIHTFTGQIWANYKGLKFIFQFTIFS